MPVRLLHRKIRLLVVRPSQIVSSLILLGLITTVQVACQPTTRQSDAVRDLLIDRISWQPYPVAADSTHQGNQLQFAVTNTSATSTYRQLRLCVDYYTPAGRRLGSDTSIVDTLVAPGTLVKLANQRIGTVRPGTSRADVRVVSATAE